MERKQNYWIHGLGLSKDVLPFNSLGSSLLGHGDNSWAMESYTFLNLIKQYENDIPLNGHVVGHGLGGHIAINVALKRKDISVTAIGMIPANNRSELFNTLKTNEKFQKFFLSKRSYQDLVEYAALLTEDLSHQSTFINSLLKQDPLFNETLFTSGFDDYDWNEVEKVRLLQDRFQLIINDQDPLINTEKARELKLNSKSISIFGHCPWSPKQPFTHDNHHPLDFSSPV